MARNKFPKGAKVKLLMCDTPGCLCQAKYTVGEDAMITSVSKKYLIAECVTPYKNLLARRILFTKATAAAHMELLEKPEPKKIEKVNEPQADPLPSVECEQLLLPLTRRMK